MLNKFRSSGRSKGTNVVVWALLGLLIVGLTGLGLGGTVTGLASQNVARVGDEPVNREDYVRTLLEQIQNFSQQVGQPLTMAQARLFGMDQQVLSQMVTRAAIDAKTRELGLSVGDRVVAEQLLRANSFQGVTGEFDQRSYEFYLQRQGLTAGEYEDRLRADVARSMLELGVAAGTEMPPVLAETIVAFTGEQRRFTYVAIGPDNLEELPQQGDDTTLRGFYDENATDYTSPETRVVTYAALLPADLATEVEVSEADLRDAYALREAQYNRPEARVLDLLAFGTQEEAEAARAEIDAGTSSFNDLAEARGLDLADISLGPVAASELNRAAREVVFGADGPGVVGPVETDLGPALYQINAIIAGQTTTFEEAEAELREAVAVELAADEVLNWVDRVADLTASGATLEELADETPMTLGEIEITDTPGEGLAGDLAFRREAFEAEVGEERDLVELTGGGIAVLRVERVQEPAQIPFEEVMGQVAIDWRSQQVQIALVAKAEALQATLSEGRTFTAAAEAEGLTALEVGPLTRNDAGQPGLPPETVTEVFSLAAGGTTILSDSGQVFLVQLEEVIPVDTSTETYAEELEAVSRRLNGQLATSVYLGFAQLLTNAEGVSINQQLIDDTLSQYP